MQDVADRAGVSRASVSLALRNHPSLPAGTRNRIQRLADELGYRPNPLVSALMTYQRDVRTVKPNGMTLAFVCRFSRGDRWRTYLSPDLITGAVREAEKHGYRLEEFWMGDMSMSQERFWKVLYQRGIRGMIIAPLPTAHGRLRLNWSHFSTVVIGYTMAHPNFHRVSTDRYRAMLMAVRRLDRMGYRRLGLALDLDQDARVNHQWAAAFQWGQHNPGSGHQRELFLVRGHEWNELNFVRWFAKASPEVVLGYDPAIVTWLRQMGKRVPEDVGFVHLWNPDTTGQYAGLYHTPPAIGGAAADLLISLVERNQAGIPESPQTLLLNATWADGATLSMNRAPQLASLLG